MTSKRLQFYKRTPNCIFPFMPGIKDMKECVKHTWRPNWAENVSWHLWWCCWRGSNTETLRHTHSIIFRRQSCCYANKPLLTDCYSVTDRMQILSSCPLSVFVFIYHPRAFLHKSICWNTMSSFLYLDILLLLSSASISMFPYLLYVWKRDLFSLMPLLAFSSNEI